MLMWKANEALWRLLDNAEAEAAEGYRVACDECAALISEDEYGERDGLCGACHAKVHFACSECGEEFPADDRSEHSPAMCTDCGNTKRQEIADDLWSQLEDLAGSWSGEDYEIERLKKLLAYAKRMK